MSSEGELRAGSDWTALATAEARSAEANHDSPWFDDTLAAACIAAARHSAPGRGQRPYSQETDELWRRWTFAYVQIRTRFFDEQLLEAVSAGCRQVVLLAAGLDARAFRLRWPDGTHIFEVDLPQTLDFKETVLAARGAAPRCQRTTVSADLGGNWGAALAAAGHRPHRPTAWLAEGLQRYLADDAYEGVLDALERLTARPSRWPSITTTAHGARRCLKLCAAQALRTASWRRGNRRLVKTLWRRSPNTVGRPRRTALPSGPERMDVHLPST